MLTGSHNQSAVCRHHTSLCGRGQCSYALYPCCSSNLLHSCREQKKFSCSAWALSTLTVQDYTVHYSFVPWQIVNQTQRMISKYMCISVRHMDTTDKHSIYCSFVFWALCPPDMRGRFLLGIYQICGIQLNSDLFPMAPSPSHTCSPQMHGWQQLRLVDSLAWGK